MRFLSEESLDGGQPQYRVRMPAAVNCTSADMHDELGLAFFFVTRLPISIGGREDPVHRDIATRHFLFKLQAHDVDHIIEELHLDTCLTGIDGISLCL